jgi:hypothetical protein
MTMRLSRALEAGAILALLGCSSGVVSPAWSSTTVTSTTVPAASLDDRKIASISRRIQADQRVLAALARGRGDDPAVRALGRRFVEDSSVASVPAPEHASRAQEVSAVEDELAERDVATALRIARYGGHSFDRVFLDADRALLETDLGLLRRALAPRAVDPRLKAGLARLETLMSAELEALENVATLEVAR